MHISTKKGDTGFTSLLGGERVPKYHIRTETVGTLDEANSFLGLARASAKDDRVKRIILKVQKHLFVIGAEVSNPKEGGKLHPFQIDPIPYEPEQLCLNLT
jgi:cob(I)alamin adenosyltransferase